MIDQSFQDLVASLAAKTPTPGGGAAAAMSACLGTSLLLMVIRFSRGKKATVDHDAELAAVEEQLDKHLVRLLPMAERDCASFDAVSNAYKLPKETDEQQVVRKRAIEEGMLGAMIVPEETLAAVRDVLRTMQAAMPYVGRNIASDLGSGAEMLVAGGESASYNVRINAAYLEDREKATAALQQCETVLRDVRDMHRAIRSKVDEMLT